MFRRVLLTALAVLAISHVSVSEEKTDKEKDLGTVIGIDLGTTYSW